MTVDEAIKLYGVQHFGSEGGKYKVSIEVKDLADDSSVIKQSGSYSSEKDEPYSYYGFDVFLRGTLGGSEYRKTAKTIDKYRIIAKKFAKYRNTARRPKPCQKSMK